MTDLKIILYNNSIFERVLVSIVNLVAVDDAVLLQNRKFRLTCSRSSSDKAYIFPS